MSDNFQTKAPAHEGPAPTEANHCLAGLAKRYAPLRQCASLSPFGTLLYDQVYFFALDAEWYPDGTQNVVISYQMGTVSEAAATNEIIYVRPGQRLRLIQLIEKALATVHGGEIPASYRQRDPRTLVVLIAHNTVAEWSVLQDRDSGAITKKLTTIRKSPVTGSEPIAIRSKLLGRVDVQIFDTMLLAPAGYGRLDRLSSLLGDEEAKKIDIPQRYKQDMRLFLNEHPAWFERYALRDTEVTLKVFVTLQEALNQLAYGETRQLFKTLAAAAVKGFLKENRWFKGYRRRLQDARFESAYRLIMRSYHGGRNEGLMVGDSREF